jgi:hypothetical protein
MTTWTYEASRRWNGAWIGGAGPYACVVSYIKGTSVTLFRKLGEAEAHKRRLDAIQPEKRRWRSTELVNLKQVPVERTKAAARGRR